MGRGRNLRFVFWRGWARLLKKEESVALFRSLVQSAMAVGETGRGPTARGRDGPSTRGPPTGCGQRRGRATRPPQARWKGSRGGRGASPSLTGILARGDGPRREVK